MIVAIFLLSGKVLPLRAADPIPYGAPIDLGAARKVMVAAEAEAKKHN